MVEINNQRKAFLDMLAWSEGTDSGRRNQKSWLWRHCRRRAIYWLLDHPRKLVTLNQSSNQQAPDAATSFPLVGCLPQAAGLKTSLRKVRTLWHCSRLERGALPDWSWWYPSGNRPLQQYLGHAGRWLWSVRAPGWQPDCKIQKAGGTVREIDIWAESPRLSRSGSLHHRLPVWAVNHYHDNAIT